MAIKMQAGSGDFTSFGGLKLFEEVIFGTNLKRRVRDLMPTGDRTTATKSYNKFFAMIMGIIAGNDCLDDMDNVTQDPIFEALCNKKTYTSQCYGQFLGNFEPWQARKLNEALRDYAFKLRMLAFPKDHDLIIDLDSTPHLQYGKTIEGAEFNYAHKFCLDSLQAYDQHGFEYHVDVRPGNTFTSKGSHHVIRSIFRGAPRRLHRFMRGDSGFCNLEVMNACIDHHVDFVIAMQANMYEPLLTKIDWWKWKPSKHTKMRDGRPCDIAVAPYYPKGLKHSVRVVMIRAKKQTPDLFGERYDYRAFVTNTHQHEMTNEEVVDFYKKRGNAENFIRETKNGFEMNNFPCRKLLSNKIYALITAFAYNTMRFVAPVLNPNLLHYSKRIRMRMVYLGAQVVKKSRYWIIRLNKHHHEEVKRWLCRIQNLLVPG